MPPVKDKKDIDPEEQMRKKFRAKCRFRAIARLVMANTYWLSEAVEEYEGLDDVKRRVEQAMRGKAKKKQLLTINDKALLNKPGDERTDHEKKYIYRIIGGLKCFKRYPNHVKKKLAALTYFKYYGPGRDIVRQHHDATAMYFIVSGKVVVSQMVFDELLNRNVSVEIGSMQTGDMFGEVSLLHNIPRTATVTSTDHCEFLALMKEDFKNVLQVSVQNQWDEVRRAMSAFSYFDALDEVARREGCIVAKLKSYEINETILGDGQGIANYVYFILAGRCQMIESLQMVVTEHLGNKFYGLYDPYISPEESEQDLDKKYFQGYKTLNTSSIMINTASKMSKLEKTLSDAMQGIGRKSKIAINERASVVPSAQPLRPSIMTPTSTTTSNLNRQSVQIMEEPESADQMVVESHARRSVLNTSLSAARNNSRGAVLSGNLGTSSSVRQSMSKVLLAPSKQDPRESMRLSTIPEINDPLRLQTYFMQVCQLNPGSSFGFGENMRDRRIVALTPVYCMLMPKIWLLQRNTANIWTRIHHYLDKKIPTKKQLFKEFVAQRRWEVYREQLVEDVVANSKTVNYTTLHDVPYSIRIEEMVDL